MIYTSNNIRILKQLEPIRMRPGMFIGSTEDATHLVKEAIDNAVDELLNGYAEKIGVFIKDNEYTIIDSGRGIPLGEVDGIPAPVVIATKLFSGGKFDKNSYKISAGLHGVGLVAVNALSEYMEIDIYRKEQNLLKHGIFKFKDGLLISNVIENIDSNFDKPYSTRITFKPDKKYFDDISINIPKTQQRLSIASMFTDKEIIFSVNGNKQIIKERINTYFLNKIIVKPLFNPIFLEYQQKNEKISMIFSYETDNIPNKIYASVNLLPVNQGSHITQIQNIFIKVFDKYRKKYNFNKTDALIGLRCYFNIFLEETSYSSQTKDSLSVNKKILGNIMNDDLVKLIDEKLTNSKVLNMLLEKFDYYRAHLKSKNIKTNFNANKTVRGIRDKDSKLKDCQNFINSELIIIEGDSAGGTCIKARDPKIHAILPLKGKILNVAGVNDFEKIVKNKEIQDIIKSIGIGVKSKTTKENIKNIRYEKIILAPDADPDGKHIATLLLILFNLYMPEVIQQGKLFLADMPLYGLTYKKKFYPAWTVDELNDLKEKYPTAQLHRFKGLGEYEPHQLATCLLDKSTRKLYEIKPVDKEYEQYLNKLVTSADEKRKLFGG